MSKLCPKCGARSSVVDSRDQGDKVMRRRDCRVFKCKTSWTTYEVDARKLKKWEELESSLESLRSIIDALETKWDE